MADLQNNSNEEKKATITESLLKQNETVNSEANQVKQPVIEKKEETINPLDVKSEDTEVKQTPIEELNTQSEEIAVKEEALIDSRNFGRDEEGFVLLYHRDYENESEAQYAKEIAGLGSILRIISEYDGVKTESSVFVSGASIIDLYENHENPTKLTGRTIAKK